MAYKAVPDKRGEGRVTTEFISLAFYPGRFPPTGDSSTSPRDNRLPRARERRERKRDRRSEATYVNDSLGGHTSILFLEVLEVGVVLVEHVLSIEVTHNDYFRARPAYVR